MRFIVEEVLEGRIGFYPTYGNTLMDLAASVPLLPEDHFSITYHALHRKPRAPYAWDGVAEVRRFGAMENKIVEGVY